MAVFPAEQERPRITTYRHDHATPNIRIAIGRGRRTKHEGPFCSKFATHADDRGNQRLPPLLPRTCAKHHWRQNSGSASAPVRAAWPTQTHTPRVAPELARKSGGRGQGWMLTSTTCQNAVSSAQEREIRMRRRRYQRGSLGVRKHGRVKVWIAQWRENGQKRS